MEISQNTWIMTSGYANVALSGTLTSTHNDLNVVKFGYLYFSVWHEVFKIQLKISNNAHIKS